MWKEWSNHSPSYATSGWRDLGGYDDEGINAMAWDFRTVAPNTWVTIIDWPDLKVLYWQDRRALYVCAKVVE